MPGIGVVRIYFQPSTDIRTATAQVTSVSQTVLRQLLPGVTPAADPELQRVDRADPAARAVGGAGWPRASCSIPR